MRGTKTNARVLLLGLDAADPRLVREWSQAGELPHLGALMERGRVAEMEDLPGLWTGAVWPSLLTGASPARHAYYHFHDYDPATYATTPYRETGYPMPPIWETLSAAGRRVAALDLPLAPESRDFDGIQLLDWGLHEPVGPVRSWPPEFAPELVERFGPDPVGQCDYSGRGPADFTAFTQRLIQRADTRGRIFGELLERGGWDLFFGAFSETHCAGHQCWHLHDPQHPAHDPRLAAELGDPLLAVYQRVDAVVGRLVEQAGPDALVLIVATHGMGPSFKAHFLLDRALQSLEGQAAPRSRLFNNLYRTWRRLPAPARALLTPLGLRARKSLAAGARRNRTSFELSTHCAYGAIRINLEGREPAGRVRPADFNRHCEELGERLLQLTDPATREPLAHRVWNTSEHYPRSPTDRLPDLIVEWRRDIAATGVHSPDFGTLDAVTSAERPNRTGDHHPHGGLVVASGPGVRRGLVGGRVSPMDVIATVLAALEVEGVKFDGRAIPGL